MNIRVLNLADAETYEPGPNEVCVSITSPAVQAELQGGWRAVPRLQFSDIDVVLPAGVALALHEILTGEPPGATLEQRYSLHNRFVRRKVPEAPHVFRRPHLP